MQITGDYAGKKYTINGFENTKKIKKERMKKKLK